MDLSAFRTSPFPVCQRQGVIFETTRAKFRTGLESSDADDSNASPSALVLQLSKELAPRAISDCSCQLMVCHHALDVQVFYANCSNLAFVGYLMRNLMKEIPSLVRNLFMLKGKALPCPISVLPSLLLSGILSRKKLQLGQRPVEILWIIKLAPVRTNSKRFDSNIDSDCRFWIDWF
jgi:hypothetical protein